MLIFIEKIGLHVNLLTLSARQIRLECEIRQIGRRFYQSKDERRNHPLRPSLRDQSSCVSATCTATNALQPVSAGGATPVNRQIINRSDRLHQTTKILWETL